MLEDKSLLVTSIKNIVMFVQKIFVCWNWFSIFFTIFSMKYHWTWKANPKATSLCWKALCPWSSTYQPVVEDICKIDDNLIGLECCISQNSLSLIIRFHAGKVKPIHIFEEPHCSLPVPINFFIRQTKDFPVEDKVRIQRAGRTRKCHIGYNW